jgi:hypothetical protein
MATLNKMEKRGVERESHRVSVNVEKFARKLV